METHIDWLGCATFRLKIGNLTIFLDTYMDRVPSAPKVGLSAANVTEADFILIGHSHFDHLAGAETISSNTGAIVVGSTETANVLKNEGIDAAKLRIAQGGERYKDCITLKEMDKMKKTSFLINTSRGKIVDEKQLVVALKTKQILGAGMDVYELEPMKKNNPLLKSNKVFLSPHTATFTEECAERMGIETIQNIIDFFDKKLEKFRTVIL